MGYQASMSLMRFSSSALGWSIDVIMRGIWSCCFLRISKGQAYQAIDSFDILLVDEGRDISPKMLDALEPDGRTFQIKPSKKIVDSCLMNMYLSEYSIKNKRHC